MLVLTGTDFPATNSSLVAAVTGGLTNFLQLPTGRRIVELAGEFPSFERVRIDLTDAASDADRLPPDPRGIGKPIPGFTISRLDVSARPIRLRGSPLALSLAADAAAFDFDRDTVGRPVLQLRAANSGLLTASIAKADAEAFILSAAQQAGADHGISISEVALDWTQLDSRSVGVSVSVTARKLVKAQITVVGRVQIDDAMIAQATDLECSGAGMISTIACAAIRPKLHQMEGKSFNLNSLAAGQVQLRDVKISVGTALTIEARFGG